VIPVIKATLPPTLVLVISDLSISDF